MSSADSPSQASDFALRLPNTQNGKDWLRQFDVVDHEAAARLLGALTLVSHSAFERAIQTLILREAEKVDGPVALYATREVKGIVNYWEAMADPEDPLAPFDPVARGSDLGSEARIAAIIRNLCKTGPAKLLNHPSLETIKLTQARAIIVVDDIIGSGQRTAEFLSAMWVPKKVKSWRSRHQIKFVSLAYSATEIGMKKVKGLRCDPEVVIERDCPTFRDIPWHHETGEAITKLCKRYGRRTTKRGMSLGYKKTMAALVFEHGCPNNAPAVLWAPVDEGDPKWRPLFPDRAVLPEQASAFPLDIRARDPIALLTDLAGDEKADLPPAILGESPLGLTTITILALVAKGIRGRNALSYATGYDAKECAELLDRCMARGYLSGTLRMTPLGRAELKQAGQMKDTSNRLPPRGEDVYYPKQLRGLP
ncbi:hypothetical protein WSK_1573 [Novosphingobium sp. Rr 2-17]|uniref:phosphoribosyltransferase-like protein n=1 Tax=Novosphingobium sp. Rr 2-17 TaxID=555793 RepID=UPI0002699850|nr:hypothetical protein [Novosphingobium sp. Rr 2-17]EIZ79825.1 hypothetical protein WSK_1573 [Novosphingobium sp. Rr 2-17]